MKKGKVLIFSAPSGSGKTTVIRHLMDQDYNLHFSVSATNRAPRGQEEHGKDYFFLSTDEFKEKVAKDDFLEWEEVYEGRFYGSLKSVVIEKLEAGQNVIFDVDVVGGLNIKKYFKEEALAVFIQPPSLESLEMRLRQRGTDEEEDILNRLEKAAWEMNFAEKFDKILINDKLPKTLKDAEDMMNEFLK